MKTIKKILVWLALLVMLGVIVSMFLPSKARVERSLLIKAPAGLIYDQVNIVKNWEYWSPWHKIDPEMKIVYEGTEHGTGAKYSWQSEHKDVGNGSLAITNAKPDEIIEMEFVFNNQSPAKSSFILGKADSSVKVTWALESELGWNPIYRFFGLFFDKMVGPDFEKGLANIKELAENLPILPANIIIARGTVEPAEYLSIKEKCRMEEIGQKMGVNYTEITTYIEEKGLKCTERYFAYYHNMTENQAEFDMEAGVTVEKADAGTDRIKAGKFTAGNAVIATYFGPYEDMGLVYPLIEQYLKAYKLLVIGEPWELYLTDPMLEPDTLKWRTDIYFPIK